MSHGGVLSIAIGSRQIHDDSHGFVVLDAIFRVDGSVRVEELVGDVSENRGAARGDAAFGHLDEEPGEKLPDVGAGGELGEFGEEVGGEVGEIDLGLLARGPHGGAHREVVKTETKMGIRGGVAASFAVGETVLAAALSRCSG
jgi:hypothetical protein